MSPHPFSFRASEYGNLARLLAVFCLMASPSAVALQATGYTAEKNDRFSSGFPNTPVENGSSNFVGSGFDWSGVAWSTTTLTTYYKGLGTLSPVHFLTAQHYEYGNELTQGIRVLGNDGQVHTSSTSTITNLGQGLLLTNYSITNYDIAIGTLATPVAPAGKMARLAVLDLHNTSGADTFSNYTDLPIFLYGRGGSATGSLRVAASSINLVAAFNSDPKQVAIRTSRTDVQLQGGDSASPALHGWTNPGGGKELTILGTNSAIDSNYNYISFLGSTAAMAAANGVMNADGFALRVVGNPTNTWVGSSSTSINNAGAWGLGGPGPPQSAPSDRFVNFKGSTAGNNRVVTVDSSHNLRGLYFLPTESQNLGFSIQGGSTLTVGRGGVTNYDASRQTFTAALALGAPQMWNGGEGGITATNIANNGHLLEITTQGVSRIDGAVSGSGGLALSGGTLELNGSNSHTGTTWAHEGTLVVNGNTAAGSTVRIAGPATLGGIGTVGGPALISGSVAPGNGIGTIAFGDNLTFNTGSILSWELTASESGRGTNYDAINIAGTLDGSGGVFRAVLTTGTFGDPFWTTTRNWTDVFADSSGNTPVAFSSLFSSMEYWQNGSNVTAGISQYGGFSISGSTLTWTAIPEPATSLAGLLLAAGLLRRRRVK